MITGESVQFSAAPYFPEDAVSRIFKLSRSATTSSKARMNSWRLVFERRAPFIESLMGDTGSLNRTSYPHCDSA